MDRELERFLAEAEYRVGGWPPEVKNRDAWSPEEVVWTTFEGFLAELRRLPDTVEVRAVRVLLKKLIHKVRTRHRNKTSREYERAKRRLRRAR